MHSKGKKKTLLNQFYVKYRRVRRCGSSTEDAKLCTLKYVKILSSGLWKFQLYLKKETDTGKKFKAVSTQLHDIIFKLMSNIYGEIIDI